MTDAEAIRILSVELWHTESHKKIEGKATEYYEELSQIAEALKMAIEALKNERPQGKWIMNKTSARGRNYTCTICKKVSRNKFDFCPNCGADMREADND